MELSWLEDFLALAESGNFSRAAKARHLTQPAFSRRIKALEQWVGVELFDRTGQMPTAAGERFRAAAAEIVGRLALARDEARAAAGTEAQAISFAATFSLSLTFFPRWLGTVTPPGPTRLVSDTADACRQHLEQGRVQFLLCHVPAGTEPEGPFRSVRIGHDVLLPLAAPHSRHALPGPAPLLAYAEGSALGRAVTALLARRPAALNPVFTSHLASILRSMALDGRGLAWLPRSLAADDLAAGTLVPAGGEDWQVALDVRLFRPRARLHPAAEALWQACCSFSA